MTMTFQRETLQRETLDNDLLPCKRNPPFIFAHYPGKWELIEEDGPKGETVYHLLPRLKRMRLEPGSNGVKGETYETVRAGLMFAWLDAEGWVRIMPDTPVIYCDESGEEVEDRGYLRSDKGRHGKVFLDVWDRPLIFGSGRGARVDWTTKRDRKGFNLWRQMLVSTGIIRKPTESELNQIIRLQRRRHHRRARDTGGSPYREGLAQKERDRLDAMLAASDRMFKTTKRRKGKPGSRAAREDIDT